MSISRSISQRSRPLLAVAAASAVLLAACGDADPPATAAAGGDGLEVLAAFYPLQFVAERVGGERVRVDNLTVPGAEPHDLELTPQDLGRLADAGLVVYLEGFQPAVDDAVAAEAADHALDVHDAAHADLAAPEEGEEHADGEEHAEGEEHAAGEEHAEGDEHGHGATDPHFWLDPLRLADVGDAVADRLAEADPDGAQGYADGAADLRADLEALDDELTAGLASCTSTDLVTAHEAFGYLAERYGLEQVGIAGITPDEEPSAADLARISDFVTDRGVTTIYTETLVSPDVAEAVAAETGATTAVLDPLEGLTEDAVGDDATAPADYLSVMRANLVTLQAGQGCG